MGLLRQFPAYTLSDLRDGPDGVELLRMLKIEALGRPDGGEDHGQ